MVLEGAGLLRRMSRERGQPMREALGHHCFRAGKRNRSLLGKWKGKCQECGGRPRAQGSGAEGEGEEIIQILQNIRE